MRDDVAAKSPKAGQTCGVGKACSPPGDKEGRQCCVVCTAVRSFLRWIGLGGKKDTSAPPVPAPPKDDESFPKQG